MTITVQARKSSTAEWGVLNALVDLNAAVKVGKITADDLKFEARAVIRQWQATIMGAYAEMEFRVHESADDRREPIKAASDELTITDDTWPRHADGSRFKIGEMSHAQQVAVARGAVARLTPEFSRLGIALSFRGTWNGPLPSSAS